MKRIVSFLLAIMMIVAIIPTVHATTDYSNGTRVVYNAEADNDGDGNPDHAETWTVTVPAQLAPGGSGNVVASGTWSSNRKLVVTADENVLLTNSIDSSNKKDLDVEFSGITLVGDNTAAVSDTKAISVDEIENALFGTWSGAFEYNVEMQDNLVKIQINVDGTIKEYDAKPNMTIADWIDSDYNTDDYQMVQSKDDFRISVVFEDMDYIDYDNWIDGIADEILITEANIVLHPSK